MVLNSKKYLTELSMIHNPAASIWDPMYLAMEDIR